MERSGNVSEWSVLKQHPNAHFCEECGFLLDIIVSSGKVATASLDVVFSLLFLSLNRSQVECERCGRKYEPKYIQSLTIVTKCKFECDGLFLSVSIGWVVSHLLVGSVLQTPPPLPSPSMNWRRKKWSLARVLIIPQ